jgi:hypothetical protein
MFMTNKKMLEEARNIVKVQAPLILKDLGLEENDGILDRIVVTDKVGLRIPEGFCNAQIEIRRRGFVEESKTYIVGSAFIEINPLNYFFCMTKKGELKKAPFIIRLFKSRLRRAVLFTLAHELRHYWQHYTGEYYKNELMMFGKSLMPYEMRWCEEDANKFARKHIEVSKEVK